ncbi:MAG: DUF86 domain-containing protein [Thermodesulfovibrionales bacterium]|nr:DUF86 domain-containing protein [Thermodesulfovibrionales bacterium]
MSERDWTIRIKDIHESLSKIIRYTEGMNLDSFFTDELKYDAVMRNFGIIGEAVKHVPDEVRAKHQDIPWKEISGMRDFVIHEYFGLDNDVVWSAIEHDVPRLKAQIVSRFSDLL